MSDETQAPSPFTRLSFWQRHRMLTLLDLMLRPSKSNAPEGEDDAAKQLHVEFPHGSLEKAFIDKAYETLSDSSAQCGLKLAVMGAPAGGVAVETDGDLVQGGTRAGVAAAHKLLLDSVTVGGACRDAPNLSTVTPSIMASAIESLQLAAQGKSPEVAKVVEVAVGLEFSLAEVPAPVAGGGTKVVVQSVEGGGSDEQQKPSLRAEVKEWSGGVEVLYHLAIEVCQALVQFLLRQCAGVTPDDNCPKFRSLCDEWTPLLLAAAVSGQRRKVENVTLKVPLTILEQQAIYWTSNRAEDARLVSQADAFVRRRIYVEAPDVVVREPVEKKEPAEGDEDSEEEFERQMAMQRRPPTYQMLTARFLEGLAGEKARLDLSDL